jgi:hypothetical protein
MLACNVEVIQNLYKAWAMEIICSFKLGGNLSESMDRRGWNCDFLNKI